MNDFVLVIIIMIGLLVVVPPAFYAIVACEIWTYPPFSWVNRWMDYWLDKAVER